MALTLNETPSANRIHIGFFGKRNSGKSSLINAFTNQEVSIVSDVPGTTTDPVYKAMEVHPLGACVIIDTAGFDDVGELGESRVEKTRLAAEKTDIAVIVIAEEEMQEEIEWIHFFKEKNTPVLILVSKADVQKDIELLCDKIEEETKEIPLIVSVKNQIGIGQIKEALTRLLPENYGEQFITGQLVSEGDLVLLVMPQDIQAPKGRLILPQVQTLRELLDKKCLVMSVTTDKFEVAIAAMCKAPKLIITDSQVFQYVYEHKPQTSMLTSFSVLFAAYKGDLPYYIEGAKAIDSLTEKSRVLIAECCTHAPLTEDIGREKIPNMLRKNVGAGIKIDNVSGTDYPEDLKDYDLIIQCGHACLIVNMYYHALIGLRIKMYQ